MGKTFTNLTEEELCDLMCGKPEEDYEHDPLIVATKEIYEELLDFYDINCNYLPEKQEFFDMETLVRALFHHLNGKVYIKQSNERYCAYEGSVNDYTIGGSISKEYKDGDFHRLIEDLTMAYYKMIGGRDFTHTPSLIEEIKCIVI